MGEAAQGAPAFDSKGRFTIVRRLGAGGMGIVYAADDRVREECVALKVMNAERSAAAWLRFKQEFRAVADVRHPNLVRLHELFAEDETLYFTMELVDGVDLAVALDYQPRERVSPVADAGREPPFGTPTAMLSRTIVADAATEHGLAAAPRESRTMPASSPDANERFRPSSSGLFWRAADRPAGAEASQPPTRRGPACDLDKLLAVLPQILDGLEALHACGLVHLDVKASNVLVSRDSTAKLADFGIARALDDPALDEPGRRIAGTALYMSPEQASGAETGPASDVYSLGATLFELIAGEPLFGGQALAVLHAHREELPRSLNRMLDGVPDRLVDICDAMLRKEPGQRPSLDQVREALGLARGAHGRVPTLDAEVASTFVGRTRELTEFAVHLERAAPGARIALVRGQSGEGKTRLLHRFAAEQARHGARVFRGRCYERESLPFSAFDRIVDQLAVALRSWPASFRREIAPFLESSGRVFPVLRLAAGAPPREDTTQDELDPRELRRRSFRALAELLQRMGELSPILLVIDDLHWTDVGSTELLDGLLDGPELPLRLVGAFRREDVSAAHPLARWLDRHAADPRLRVLDLAPLAHHEVSALLRRATGDAADPSVVDAVYAQTGGHALFVAAHAGSLREHAPRTPDPPTLAELLAYRLDATSPEARAVIDLAAASGGSCTPQLLALAGAPPRLHELLDGLVDAGILRRAREIGEAGDDERPWYDFRHDRLRELAYDALDANARRLAHARLARALESDTMTGWPGRTEALSRHFEAAGESAKATKYLDQAIEDAVSVLAFDRACALLGRRVHQERDALLRARLLWRLAELRELAADYDGTGAAFGDAARAFDEAGASRERMRARLREASLHVRTGRLREGIALFDRALEPLGLRVSGSLFERGPRMAALFARAQLPALFRRRPDDDDLLVLVACWTVIEAFVQVQSLASAEFVLRARVLARGIDHPAADAISAITELLIETARAPSPAREAHTRRLVIRARELVARWERSGDDAPPRAIDLLVDIVAAMASVRSADLDSAIEHVRGALGRWQHAPNLWWVVAARGLLVQLLTFAGRDEEVERLAPELLALGSGHVAVAAAGAQALFLVHVRRGEVDEAERVFREWLPLVPEAPANRMRLWLDTGRLVLLLLRGDPQRVLDLYEVWGREYRRAGFLLDVSNEIVLSTAPLEAAMVLAERGQLSRGDRARMMRLVRRLSSRSSTPTRAIVARAEAELRYFAGERGWEQCLREALEISPRAPYERWLVLGTVRRLGQSTPALDEEHRALAERKGWSTDEVVRATRFDRWDG